MRIVKQICLLTLFSLFLFGACTSDGGEQTTVVNVSELLTGHWVLTQAIRNQKPAPTMEGTYFDFMADKSMVTNMMGSAQNSTFTIQEQLISSNYNGIKTDYAIEKITEDSLIITTNIRGFNFHLSLKKGVEKESM